MTALAEGIDDLQSLGGLEAPNLTRLGLHDDAELFGQLVGVDATQQLLDRLGTHARLESIRPERVPYFSESLFGKQLALFEICIARIDDYVAFEIEDPLQVPETQIQEVTDATRQPLEKPDVRDRARQLDVAHALAAHARSGHFHPALVADDTAVLHPLVFAAQALPVRDGTEDLGAKQTVTFRFERPVVDGFGFRHLAMAPRANLLR